eukprot:GHVU01138196.1.p1 GENE.GHVU01138196.1~~GHVU01138196.1.p1  ORF type:complete len:144 (-),score=3.25 GHVU01138196.1:1030-1461(-)
MCRFRHSMIANLIFPRQHGNAAAPISVPHPPVIQALVGQCKTSATQCKKASLSAPASYRILGEQRVEKKHAEEACNVQWGCVHYCEPDLDACPLKASPKPQHMRSKPLLDCVVGFDGWASLCCPAGLRRKMRAPRQSQRYVQR